ncbi:TPA: glycosyltransferase family 4 protein [Vibrio vulnificus]
MKKSKVAFLSLNYKPSVGGLVRYIESFGTDLTERGYDVDIYCSDGKNDKLKERESIDGFSINRFRVLSFNRLFYPLTPILAWLKFKRELNNIDWEQYEVIIVRHVYTAAALIGNKKAMQKAIYLCPLISSKLQKINSSSQGVVYKIYSFLLFPQLLYLEKLVVNKFDRFSVLSKSKKFEVQEYFNTTRSIEIIPPGINMKEFYPSNDKENSLFRDDLNIRHNEFVYVTVCRLVDEKNVGMLIEAFSELYKSNRDTRLVIVGDGPLLSALKSLSKAKGCENSVLFVGYQEQPRRFYSMANCFVLPSFYEGFGHVFLEANACGIPAIGFKNSPPKVITATDEIIVEGLNGYIANEYSSEALLLSMLKAYKNRSDFSMAYKNSIVKYVEDNYTWKVHYKKLVDQLNE